MAFDELLADRIREALRRRRGVEEKKMFGGLGFLLDGNMLGGVWKNSLVVRVGLDEYYYSLLEPHVSEFNITGKALRGWVLVGPDGVGANEQVSEWIQRAIKFVGKLPSKEK